MSYKSVNAVDICARELGAVDRARTIEPSGGLLGPADVFFHVDFRGVKCSLQDNSTGWGALQHAVCVRWCSSHEFEY
jgi:hypothetical protein